MYRGDVCRQRMGIARAVGESVARGQRELLPPRPAWGWARGSTQFAVAYSSASCCHSGSGGGQPFSFVRHDSRASGRSLHSRSLHARTPAASGANKICGWALTRRRRAGSRSACFRRGAWRQVDGGYRSLQVEAVRVAGGAGGQRGDDARVLAAVDVHDRPPEHGRVRREARAPEHVRRYDALGGERVVPPCDGDVGRALWRRRASRSCRRG